MNSYIFLDDHYDGAPINAMNSVVEPFHNWGFNTLAFEASNIATLRESARDISTTMHSLLPTGSDFLNNIFFFSLAHPVLAGLIGLLARADLWVAAPLVLLAAAIIQKDVSFTDLCHRMDETLKLLEEAPIHMRVELIDFFGREETVSVDTRDHLMAHEIASSCLNGNVIVLTGAEHYAGLFDILQSKYQINDEVSERKFFCFVHH